MTGWFSNIFADACILFTIHMDGESTRTVTAELYVRSLRPRATYDRQRRAIDRLEALADAGQLADYDVYVTGRAIPASPADALTELGSYLLNRVAVFEEWAARSDRPLAAPIERRSLSSAFTGDRYDALVLPDLLLAEYVDGALRFVAPSGEGEAQVSVHDRLDALEADEFRPGDATALERAGPAPDHPTSPVPE